jgi:hypothetical protein
VIKKCIIYVEVFFNKIIYEGVNFIQKFPEYVACGLENKSRQGCWDSYQKKYPRGLPPWLRVGFCNLVSIHPYISYAVITFNSHFGVNKEC